MTDILFATAPCTFGVDNPSSPDLIKWIDFLDKASELHICNVELGPMGYFPIEDTETVLEEICTRGIRVIAGTVFDRLISRSRVEELKTSITKLCEFLVRANHATARPPYLVIIDWGYEARSKLAGNSRLAPRLDKETRKRLIENISYIANIARNLGVDPLIHPHVGGHIEFYDEIEEVMDHLCGCDTKLCLDTGHAFYAGINPINMIEVYSDLIEYVHVKDFDLEIYMSCVRDKRDFFDACADGLTCAIGDGCLDYGGIVEALRDINYAGYLTIEIEKSPVNWRHASTQLTRSTEYLEKLLNTPLNGAL
ncbi:sugar phosphate isomerase/epimerase family protein [Alicyclobacillus sendaiensis]|uniref:TIM barrel protein n=1 Tax=Alicyclobacillus sendaiensis PA2 TaxID=3029425 RepID=A0ABT6Y1W9_ALISE|nr:TIM barrel protein [Alicyclobacillus sendaiensis]MDI9261210.1 TIM barrel protein [Alicyclobacillus sendaiensis PA2]